MSANKYKTGRAKITSALYGYGDAPLERHPNCINERQVIAKRLDDFINGIDQSKLLRDELISAGLSPDLIKEGVRYHIEFMLGAK